MLVNKSKFSSDWTTKVLLVAALLWPVSALPKVKQGGLSPTETKPTSASSPKVEKAPSLFVVPTAPPPTLVPQTIAQPSFQPNLVPNLDLLNERPLSTKVAYGILGTGLAISTLTTATLIGLNWGPSDAGTIQLGYRCGPLGNMDCGSVTHDLKSGVWVGVGTVSFFVIGLIVTAIVEHFEGKKKHPPTLLQVGFNPNF